MPDNFLSDPVFADLARILGSPEAAARWVRSMKGSFTSASTRALIEKTGGLPQAVTWLQEFAPRMPRDAKQIERFHVRVRDAKTDKFRETTVSLDSELYRALIDKTGSGQAASTWISKTARALDPGAGSLSRALQAAIVRLVSEHPPSGV